MSDYNDLDSYFFITLLVLLVAMLVLGITELILKYARPRVKAESKTVVETEKHAETATTYAAIPQYDWHTLSVAQALHKQDSQLNSGLTSDQVTARQAVHGLNKLTENPPEPAWRLLLAQFKSVLIFILIIAAGVATAIGDIVDGVVILVVVMINAGLGFYQEYQAEKSLLALKKMLALRATVRRDGQAQELPAEQVVQGDIVLLNAGDKIPADGRIVACSGLEVDESSFTGESLPVVKQKQELPDIDTPVAERTNMLYMNNTLVRGRAELLVTATGMDTEIGKLADFLSKTEEESTPLQIQLDSLGKRLAILAVVIIALLFASALLRGEPLIETAFTAIALAVAAIPEGLPAVVTVTLALGMHRMAKQRAIIKRLSAVETLGCTTVICTDKTGTLTVNQMTARSLYYQEQSYSVSGEGYELVGEISPFISTEQITPLLQTLVLCNDSFMRDQQILGDPMEGALLVLAAKGGLTKEQANAQLPRIAEIPFDAEHKFMASFHRCGTDVKVFVKGAPEMLLNRCQYMRDKDGVNIDIDTENLLQQNANMAETGLRVLGLAMKTLPISDFSSDADLFACLEGLAFIGLVGLMDPPREEVKNAIKLCQQAGIAVKMITGDQRITASAIAQEIGLTGDILDGTELLAMDDETLATQIDNIGVFARTAPEQKVRIVAALKAGGHIAAMTGDGVNDAPALKCADIGIAMGIMGTDVAKEAATMILTDDNFATIVKAIKEGRGIYENMVKFIRFQLSTNIGAILCVAIAPMLGLPLPFTAIQLLWINIIMDGPPAMSLGVDAARINSMNEPPRKTDDRVLSLRRLTNLFFYGATMAIGTLGVLYFDLQNGAETLHATSLAFTTFVLFQIFNAFNARSEKGSAFNSHFFSNKALWGSIIGVLILQIIIMQWAEAEVVFRTTALSLEDWGLATAIAASVLILEEARKVLMKIVR